MTVKRKCFPTIAIGLFLLISSLSFQSAYVSASDEENPQESMSFNMTVDIPDNQINKSASYFDLLVKPNSEQDLKLTLSNTGNKPKKLRVRPTDATTNQNGVIDYSIPDKDYHVDSTLKIPFTSLISQAQEVEVAPGEKKELTFKLNTPSEPFKGLILGGFVADIPSSNDDKQDNKGIKITNKFQLVKAVMLRSEEEKVDPKLVLNDVKPNLVSYRTAVTANLQNTQPAMFGKMSVDAKITKKGSDKVIRHSSKENMEMAPNSNFDYAILWDNEPLKPGNYTLSLVAKSGKHEWPFTKDFSIAKEDSEKLNKEAVELTDDSNIPMWVWILIAVLVLIIIVLAIVYFKNKAKKEKVKKKKRPSSKKKKTKKTRD